MTNVKQKFQENELETDLEIKAPDQLLQVSFENYTVNLGNELNLKHLKSPPHVHWDGDSDALYTLVMIDPDAPSRFQYTEREYKHWIVINIKGTDVKKGKTIVSYFPPSPPPSMGLHRYVFLLFKQEEALKDSVSNESRRANFHVAKFAAENQLGDPIAGNFLQAENKEVAFTGHAHHGLDKK